jgi:hypothetical protein
MIARCERSFQLVFRGTVTEIRDHEIIFRVECVWKGPVSYLLDAEAYSAFDAVYARVL